MKSLLKSLLVLACLLNSCLALQSSLPTHADRRASKKGIAPFRLPEKKEFEQFLAYFTIETGWRTELQLRNNISNAANVPVQYQNLTARDLPLIIFSSIGVLEQVFRT